MFQECACRAGCVNLPRDRLCFNDVSERVQVLPAQEEYRRLQGGKSKQVNQGEEIGLPGVGTLSWLWRLLGLRLKNCKIDLIGRLKSYNSFLYLYL